MISILSPGRRHCVERLCSVIPGGRFNSLGSSITKQPHCSRLFGVLCKHRPIIKGLVSFPGAPHPHTSSPLPMPLLILPLCKGFVLMSILTVRAPMCALRCRHNNGILISLQVAGAFIHTSAAASTVTICGREHLASFISARG